MRIALIASVAVSAIAFTAVGQVPNSQATQPPSEPPQIKCVPMDPLRQMYVVAKGMPYSAIRVSTCDVTKPDGTHVKGKKTRNEWRDAEGRTRLEEDDTFVTDRKTRNVTIVDPVAHAEWTFSIGEGVDKTAILWKYSPAHDTLIYPTTYSTQRDGSSSQRIVAPLLHAEGPGYRDETLKDAYVNGVWCQGNRYINRVAPGMMNNKTDHEQIVVTETWYSVDLHEEVRSVDDDPSLGKYERELVNIDRGEPDPALFRPPADYGVLESRPNSESAPQPNRQIIIQSPK